LALFAALEGVKMTYVLNLDDTFCCGVTGTTLVKGIAFLWKCRFCESVGAVSTRHSLRLETT
jgi:hypothetical protein